MIETEQLACAACEQPIHTNFQHKCKACSKPLHSPIVCANPASIHIDADNELSGWLCGACYNNDAVTASNRVSAAKPCVGGQPADASAPKPCIGGPGSSASAPKPCIDGDQEPVVDLTQTGATVR